ncbi:MAG: formylglycine-generating enzyme family protein [Gammaproteobacteria bacterium]|nr:formylglycine-generating enzyme family protein [Gammaproteobacteria bacterium]
MFASKFILKYPTLLVLLSLLLCVSYSQAQQQSEESDTSSLSPADSSEDEGSIENRRIDRLGEGSAAQWEMDLALPGEAPSVPTNNDKFALPDEEQDRQLQQLLSKLAQKPDDGLLLEQLNTLLLDVLSQANHLIDSGSSEQVGELLSLIQSIDPALTGLNAAKTRLLTLNELGKLLSAGNAALESGRLLEPENNSALYYFEGAVKNDPRSQAAQHGLARLQEMLVELALECARELDFETADAWLQDASTVWENQDLVEASRIEIASFKQEYAVELELKAIGSMNSGNYDFADFHIIDLIALGGQEDRIKALREQLEEARHYGGFEPGQVFSDELLQSGGMAPEIVIIAAGSYLMGSRQRSTVAKDHEKPQHRITIQHGFGLGVREVTVDEFRLFVERSGYRTAAELSGKSRVYDEATGRLSYKDGINWQHDYKGRKAKPDMPVLHVTVGDARLYARWLAAETGKRYRLPSEAEYEYVARAGGNGTYWWGDGVPTEAVENLTGERDKSPAKRQWTTSFKRYGDGHWGPAPAGSFNDAELTHPMGVLDIAGNVSEWTEDCWHQNYVKAPTDGSAWVNPGCNRHVARGGYWASAPDQSRAAFRIAAKADSHGPVIGFRIARDL